MHFHTDFVLCSQQGNIIPPSVKPGDEVLLPEYGGTKVVLEDKVYKKERKNEKLNKYIQKPILLYHLMLSELMAPRLFSYLMLSATRVIFL